MSIVKIGTGGIVPFRGGLATFPFEAELPEVCSITLGRLQVRLSDHQSVILVARDRHLAFSAIGCKEGREEQANGLADGKLRIHANGENAAAVIKRMLPVFRLNPAFEVHGYPAHPLFATQASFGKDTDDAMMQNIATIGGLIQDVALMGRDARWDGAATFLSTMRDPKTHNELLGNEVDKLHFLYREGLGPKYGEVSELVLGFAHAVSTRTVYPGQGKASLEQVYEAAAAALGYFDVRTVAHAFVVGALDAAARLDGKKDRRISEYNQKLQEVMNPSLGFSNCGEGFKKLADDMRSVPQLTFLGASLLLLAGCEHLESASAYKYMGLKSSFVGAARSMFRSAHIRMDMFADEILRVDAMRLVFIEYAKRRIDELS